MHGRRAFEVQHGDLKELLTAIKEAFMREILANSDQNAQHINEPEGRRIQLQDVGTVHLSIVFQGPVKDSVKDPYGDLSRRRLFQYFDGHVEDLVGRPSQWVDGILLQLLLSNDELLRIIATQETKGG
jgi:hypothetical protein